MHSLSKYNALVENFGSTPNVIFKGQANATIHLYASEPLDSLKMNTQDTAGVYDVSKKVVQIKIRKNK